MSQPQRLPAAPVAKSEADARALCDTLEGLGVCVVAHKLGGAWYVFVDGIYASTLEENEGGI